MTRTTGTDLWVRYAVRGAVTGLAAGLATGLVAWVAVFTVIRHRQRDMDRDTAT